MRVERLTFEICAEDWVVKGWCRRLQLRLVSKAGVDLNVWLVVKVKEDEAAGQIAE